MKVVGIAADGLDALAKIRDLRPDVVTLDVLMPRLDGLKVLACVMRESPVRVLMLSSLTQEGADETLQALELGAVDFIDKTALLVSGDPATAGRELLSKIHTAAAVDPSRLGRRDVDPRRDFGRSGAAATGRRRRGGDRGLHGRPPGAAGADSGAAGGSPRRGRGCPAHPRGFHPSARSPPGRRQRALGSRGRTGRPRSPRRGARRPRRSSPDLLPAAAASWSWSSVPSRRRRCTGRAWMSRCSPRQSCGGAGAPGCSSPAWAPTAPGGCGRFAPAAGGRSPRARRAASSTACREQPSNWGRRRRSCRSGSIAARLTAAAAGR